MHVEHPQLAVAGVAKAVAHADRRGYPAARERAEDVLADRELGLPLEDVERVDVICVHVRVDALEVRPKAELDHLDLGQLGENPVISRLADDSLAVVRAERDALLVHGATIPAHEPSTYTETMEINPSTLELLTWVTARERSYEDVVDAWRSNCPRHAVWDDAVTAGLVTAGRTGVALTERGRAALAASS